MSTLTQTCPASIDQQSQKEVNLQTQYLLFLAACALFFAVFGFTSIDTFVQNQFFDFSSNVFPAKNNPFIEKYLHTGLKTAMYVAGFAAVLWFGTQLRKPLDDQLKYSYIAAMMATIIAPSAVAILKSFSAVHCPWSLDIYGGKAVYLPLIEILVSSEPGGKCFPAGHASGGFVWLSWTIIFWHSRRMLALAAGIAGLVLGLIMGVSRMMQGAHFLSHTVAAVLVVWLTALLCIHIARFFRKLSKNHKSSFIEHLPDDHSATQTAPPPHPPHR